MQRGGWRLIHGRVVAAGRHATLLAVTTWGWQCSTGSSELSLGSVCALPQDRTWRSHERGRAVQVLRDVHAVPVRPFPASGGAHDNSTMPAAGPTAGDLPDTSYRLRSNRSNLFATMSTAGRECDRGGHADK